jgi:hypothetical protein
MNPALRRIMIEKFVERTAMTPQSWPAMTCARHRSGI